MQFSVFMSFTSAELTEWVTDFQCNQHITRSSYSVFISFAAGEPDICQSFSTEAQSEQTSFGFGQIAASAEKFADCG